MPQEALQEDSTKVLNKAIARIKDKCEEKLKYWVKPWKRK